MLGAIGDGQLHRGFGKRQLRSRGVRKRGGRGNSERRAKCIAVALRVPIWTDDSLHYSCDTTEAVSIVQWVRPNERRQSVHSWRMPTCWQPRQRVTFLKSLRYLLATLGARAASQSRMQASRSDT